MSHRQLPTVLFVATPAALGGSNRSLITLLKSLEGEVERVLASPSFGSFKELVDQEGLADEYVQLPRKPNHRIDRALRLLGGVKLAWWTLRNRRRLKAIHANALTGLNLAALAAMITQRPTVVWIHDPVGSPWGRRLGPLLRRMLPKLRFAAVSPTAEAVAVDNGLCQSGDATIIPNPIDPEEIVAAVARRDEEPITIGILGGASHRKGFDLMPEVIDGLADLPVTWMLYVHLQPNRGNQTVWDELDRFPRSLVDPVGKTSNVREAYATLDIVFCPSRAESFCRVAAEAMMNGIPVVGSDIDPLKALLGDDDAGLIFPSEDVSAAIAALRALVEDRDLRKSLGQVGLIRAKRFAPEAIARDLTDLYGITS
ncbi:MAG: glycosyltransferase family 4 protein [Actinomycetota bacterium]